MPHAQDLVIEMMSHLSTTDQIQCPTRTIMSLEQYFTAMSVENTAGNALNLTALEAICSGGDLKGFIESV